MTADTSATDRMLAMLSDPDARFTPEQLVWFIQFDRDHRIDDPELSWHDGYRRGYQDRVDEENRTYRQAVEAASADSGLRQLVETVDARQEADRAARLPRPGDFQGGLPLPGRQGSDHDDQKEAA